MAQPTVEPLKLSIFKPFNKIAKKCYTKLLTFSHLLNSKKSTKLAKG